MDARRFERRAHRRLVVDDEPDVPFAIDVRCRVACEREELVAHVDERHLRADAPAQLELEELRVPGERLVEVADLERNVVDADDSRHGRDVARLELLREPRCSTGVEGRPQNERELALRAQRGDARAYEELVRPHQEIAFRVAYVITRNAADAEDAAQDGLVKAWRALGRFRAGEPLRPWLLQIVANEARNRRRSAGRREHLALRCGRERSSGEAAPSPEDADARRGRARAPARRARASCRTTARDVLACRYLLELSEEETAAALGVARGTVKSRSARALDRLRETYETSSAELRALAIDWPQTPQFELALAPAPPARRWPLAVAIAAAAVAAALAVPESRGAILRFFHLGGVTIEVVDTLPRADERPLDAGLGPVVSVAEARRVHPDLLAAAARPPPPLHETPGNVVSLVFQHEGNPVLLSEFGRPAAAT